MAPMDVIAAQDQAKPGRPARRPLEWKNFVRETESHRHSSPSGKRASANDFRALTAKISKRNEAPSPGAEELALEHRNGVAAFHADAPIESPVSFIPSTELLTQPAGESEHADGDEILALIKAAIEEKTDDPPSEEAIEAHSTEDMLALIRAAVFAEIDSPRPEPKVTSTPQGEIDAEESLPLADTQPFTIDEEKKEQATETVFPGTLLAATSPVEDGSVGEDVAGQAAAIEGRAEYGVLPEELVQAAGETTEETTAIETIQSAQSLFAVEAIESALDEALASEASVEHELEGSLTVEEEPVADEVSAASVSPEIVGQMPKKEALAEEAARVEIVSFSEEETAPNAEATQYPAAIEVAEPVAEEVSAAVNLSNAIDEEAGAFPVAKDAAASSTETETETEIERPEAIEAAEAVAVETREIKNIAFGEEEAAVSVSAAVEQLLAINAEEPVAEDVSPVAAQTETQSRGPGAVIEAYEFAEETSEIEIDALGASKAQLAAEDPAANEKAEAALLIAAHETETSSPAGEETLASIAAEASAKLEAGSEAFSEEADAALPHRGPSIDHGSSYVDEFSATYGEFSKPRATPPVSESEPAKDEFTPHNGKGGLARPAEFKFWEQAPNNEAKIALPPAANGNAPGLSLRPALATAEPSAPAAPILESPPPAAALELPSEQAGQVAQSLLDIMSLTNDSVQPQERALAADTLLHLIHRLPLKILIATAERLSLTDTPPPRIVTRLIRDSRIEVAGPLLEKCNSISDKDLTGVISEGHHQSIRMIARRRSLSPALCDALIATREPSTVLTLVRNPGAELSHHAFYRLNLLAKELATLQAPLATRADLPAPLAFELFWVLPAELRRYVLSRFLPDSLTLERILKITKSVGSEDGEGTTLKFPPREKIEEFLSLLLAGQTEEGAVELAALAGIHRGAAHRIIADHGGDPLAIALKALGVQRSRFEEFMEAFRHTAGQTLGAERNAEDLQSLFDSLSFNKARVLLTYWDWAVSGTGPYAELAS